MNKNRIIKAFTKILYGIIFLSILTGCEKTSSVKDDTLKLAALKNVNFSYDSLAIYIGFPEGALESNKSFQELLEDDKKLYSDPAEYTIKINSYFFGDNTSEDAKDARFEGIINNLILDTIYSNPVEMKSDSFTIEKDKSKTLTINSLISLETHRLPGLYIFKQTVEGDYLDTKMVLELLYNIAGQEGSFNLPEIQQNIPTRASDETKELLSGILESGIFDEVSMD